MDGGKAKISLFLGLKGIELVFVCALIFSPFLVSAGIFSVVAGMFTASSTRTEEIVHNSQNMALLQASVNFDPTAKGGPEVIIEDDKALAYEANLGGGNEIDRPGSDQISVYEVREGDSLQEIAKMFGVSVNTIKWANDIGTKGIKEGDIITILPISGIKYTVKKGDTLKDIAKRHKADFDDMLQFNSLTVGSSIAQGDTIIIPDAEPEITSKKSTTKIATGLVDKGYFARPLKGGVKTQGIHGNNAVDIAASTGTEVYAAADGQVIVAKGSGWNGGYGNYVVIKHGNGTQTLYAHLNSVGVVYNQKVAKGQVIGAVGNSGKSTGPHLHVEVRGATNPF